MNSETKSNPVEGSWNTLLANYTPPRPERALLIKTAWNKGEILQTRPDVAQKYAGLTATERDFLYVIRYKTTDLSIKDFLVFTQHLGQTKLEELISRQFARIYLSKGCKVVPEIKKGNFSLSAITPHFDAEEAEVDTRVSYPYEREKGENSPDRWTNALLALKLIDIHSQNPEISNLVDLKKFAEANHLKLSLKALFFGFVDLTNEKVFSELLKRGVVDENNFEVYFLRISSLLSEIAVNRSVSSEPRKSRVLTNPYPLGSSMALDGFFPGVERPVQWPTAYYLPDMIISFIRYVDMVPENVKEGTQFPISELVSSRGKVYQYARDVLLHHMLVTRALPEHDYETIIKDCVRFDPRENFYEQIREIFHKPLLLALKGVRENDSISDQLKKEVTGDVQELAEICLSLDTEYENALNNLAKNPEKWNRTQPTHDQGEPLTFSQIRSNIIAQGGKPNRSMVAAIQNFRTRLQSGQDD